MSKSPYFQARLNVAILRAVSTLCPYLSGGSHGGQLSSTSLSSDHVTTALSASYLHLPEETLTDTGRRHR